MAKKLKTYDVWFTMAGPAGKLTCKATGEYVLTRKDGTIQEYSRDEFGTAMLALGECATLATATHEGN